MTIRETADSIARRHAEMRKEAQDALLLIAMGEVEMPGSLVERQEIIRSLLAAAWMPDVRDTRFLLVLTYKGRDINVTVDLDTARVVGREVYGHRP